MDEMQNGTGVSGADEFLEGDVVMSRAIEIPDEFVPCKDKEALVNAYMGTGDVAQELGVHRNIVLNYTNTFYEYLSVIRNPANNRLRYTLESVTQLAFLINDVKNSRRSMSQELQFIRSKVGGKAMNMVARNTETVEGLFNSLFEKISEDNRKNSEMLLERLGRNEQLRLESEEASVRTLEELEKSVEELRREIASQKEARDGLLEEKDREIERLEAVVREQEEALQKKRKKWFFQK